MISSSSCHAPVLWVRDGAATEMAMGSIGMAGLLKGHNGEILEETCIGTY